LEPILRLQVEKAIYGGAGLARAENRVVFVPFTLPGELVDARVIEGKRGYSMAELEAVVAPSAARVPAPCSYFGECGGCHYQHATYAAQVEMKAAILRETLERARVNSLPEITAITAEPFGYRNRVRLHVSHNPFRLGYKRRNSTTSLPVDYCPIAAPLLQRAIAILAREGDGLGLAAWAKEIELFTNAEESAALAALWTEWGRREARLALNRFWPEVSERIPEMAGAGIFPLAKGRRATRLLAHAGESLLHYRCANRCYRVSLGSFFQVNRFLIDELVRLVTEGERGNTAWDLYAGVGLFSQALASHFVKVTAVESAECAARDLRENLQGKQHRVTGSTTAAFLLQAAARSDNSPELVVVDPPREGLGREVTSLLGRILPPRLTYVSCDPATLGRDLAALQESGYRLAQLHLIDLFPQTFHIESVARLMLG
jgi:23S rRNA (uracil1939-C5)-methyltransferase